MNNSFFLAPTKHLIWVFLGWLLCMQTCCFAQSDFPYDKAIYPEQLRVNGVVVAWNGNQISQQAISQLFQFTPRSDARIVSIFLGDSPDAEAQEVIENLTKALEEDSRSTSGQAAKNAESSFIKFRVSDVDVAGDEYLVLLGKLKVAIKSASGVLVHGHSLEKSHSKLLADLRLLLLKVAKERRSIVFGGQTFRLAGQTVIMESSTDEVNYSMGLDAFPGMLISDPHSQKTGASVFKHDPLLVSAGIPPNTGIVLSGRRIQVLGEGKVKFQIAGNQQQKPRSQEVKHRGRRGNPYRDLIDLTAWRRDAIDRSLAPFPLEKVVTPKVANGTLLIVGGGRTPRGLMNRFIELAGGKDAKLIYVPCAESENAGPAGQVTQWRRVVASAHMLHTKDRVKADTDEDFLKELSEATGIWFGGGRQWNFVDSYYGTKAHQLMLDVLDRGGVIGGSSAGASIQGEYLARANPVGNIDIMAPGYERGLGFIRGVAIDQHFSQRNRHNDMDQLVSRYPQLLGIGLDEGTAIVVQGSIAEVVGRGKVFFFDRQALQEERSEKSIPVAAGEKFDLAKRKVVVED